MNLERDKFMIVKMCATTRMELLEARDYNKDLIFVERMLEKNRIKMLERQLRDLGNLWVHTVRADSRYHNMPLEKAMSWLNGLVAKQEYEYRNMLDHLLND